MSPVSVTAASIPARPSLARGRHINGIENFWNHPKRVLRKYSGIPHKRFHLFLKEYEFRFNYGIPKHQLAQLRRWAKSKLAYDGP